MTCKALSSNFKTELNNRGFHPQGWKPCHFVYICHKQIPLMILIADSGATKIKWIVVDRDQVYEPIETAGFNPYFMNPSVLDNILEKDLAPFLKIEAIREVFFYGAGCSTTQKCGIVDQSLSQMLHRADIEVQHDLLGAARALFGKDEGIACILGTGSNSCQYDGKTITENVTSLGYLFGDEGSGAYLGKMLLQDYLKAKMPDHIRQAFEKKYALSIENILDAVYNKPYPNRFLASFSLFLGQWKDDEYVNNMLEVNFERFFEEQVTRYTRFKELPLGVIGSVGYNYKEIFERIAARYGLKVSIVLRSPIEGLVKYHQPR